MNYEISDLRIKQNRENAKWRKEESRFLSFIFNTLKELKC